MKFLQYLKELICGECAYMSTARYWKVELGCQPLTRKEKEKGWHFCPRWDYRLIGPGMAETVRCDCFMEQTVDTSDDDASQ